MRLPMEKTVRFVNSLTFQLEITAKIFNALTESYFNQEVKNRITLDEYIVLDTIICYPHIDKSTLAKTLVKDRSSVEKIISKLQKKKLIREIKNNGTEIQVSNFELTKDGNRVYQDIAPKNDKMVGVLAKFLTEAELVSFTKTLLKVRNILISLSDAEYKR